MELQITKQVLYVIWLILTAALNEAWELRNAISIRLLTIDNLLLIYWPVY